MRKIDLTEIRTSISTHCGPTMCIFWNVERKGVVTSELECGTGRSGNVGMGVMRVRESGDIYNGKHDR